MIDLTVGIVGDLFPVSLKQQLLLFDRLVMINIPWRIAICRMMANKTDEPAKSVFLGMANDLEFLADKELVLEGGERPSNDVDLRKEGQAYRADIPVVQNSELGKIGLTKEGYQDFRVQLACYDDLASSDERGLQGFYGDRNLRKSDIELYLTLFSQYLFLAGARHQLASRMLARIFRSLEDVDASAVITEDISWPEDWLHFRFVEKAEVLEVVLDKIPVPSDLTPWEQIIEFRQSDEAKGYLSGLRVWMSEVARQQLSAKESKQKLEWLYFQQSQHLKTHKIVEGRLSFGAAFVGAAEVFEDLVKIRWGKAAQGVVSLFNRQATLLKTEIEGPAREVSYLIRAQNQFARGRK
jgi:hypothetical protein